ncbi:MAG TPA: hypothetical protein VGR62_16645 [Candidatus Binatia bacterium]|jgi:hypothetical protein|nr:hypothetical protein [Candidatus Binatia bacterium]
MAETTIGGDRAESLFTPEVFLPEQMSEPRADSLISGERALMLAILEDAIRCAQAPQKGRQRMARDAQAWMRSRNLTWPFSFVNICDTLDLPADKLRAAVLGRVHEMRRSMWDPEKVRELSEGRYRLHLRVKPRRQRMATSVRELSRKVANG